MISLSLLFRSRADEAAANSTTASEQAWAAAMSGVEEALRIVTNAPPGAIDWQDNPSMFRERLVYEDGSEQWYFTIYSPVAGDSLTQIRYGLSDEASRLNLNHLGKADLSKLPQMTADLAQAIFSFTDQSNQPPGPTPDAAMDSDQETAGAQGGTATDAGANGAGSPQTLQDTAGTQAESGTNAAPPRQTFPRHGALLTLDQLLLAPGLSWTLLHGKDAGPDSKTDPGAGSVQDQFPTATSGGSGGVPDQGLARFFTVDSYDPSRTDAGGRKTNLNDPSDPLPSGDAPAPFTNYIAALRSSKARLNHPVEALEAKAHSIDGRGVGVEVASGVTKDNLPQFLDLFTTDSDARHYGLVNINTAEAAVLACLPGVDSSLAEAIVSTRAGISQEQRGSIAWIYLQGLVDAARFKALAPLITARSFQFHFRIVGYSLPSGNYRVYEVAMDAARSGQAMTYLREITRLGLPFKLRPANPSSPNEDAALPPPPSRLARNTAAGIFQAEPRRILPRPLENPHG